MIPKSEKRKSGKDSTAKNVGILKFFGRNKRIYLRARKMIVTNFFSNKVFLRQIQI